MPIRTTSHRLSVDHIEMRSPHSVQQVHAKLQATLPRLDPRLAEMLADGDVDGVARARRDGPPLWLFEVRDMGALVNIEGRRLSVYQYEIGNPLTAERMVRHQSGAGLYAPLRVVLYEEERGCVFAYDRPSNLFGQFADERVTAVGRELDAEIEGALALAMA